MKTLRQHLSLQLVWETSGPQWSAHTRAAYFAGPAWKWLEDRLAPAAHDTLATAIPLTLDSNQQRIGVRRHH